MEILDGVQEAKVNIMSNIILKKAASCSIFFQALDGKDVTVLAGYHKTSGPGFMKIQKNS